MSRAFEEEGCHRDGSRQRHRSGHGQAVRRRGRVGRRGRRGRRPDRRGGRRHQGSRRQGHRVPLRRVREGRSRGHGRRGRLCLRNGPRPGQQRGDHPRRLRGQADRAAVG